jgi:hypothetical protein
MSRQKSALFDAFTAVTLGALNIIALLRTTANLGYARDEGFYFHAATSYARWFELFVKDRPLALDPRTIDAYWGVNHEHPGLVKSLFALSHLGLQQKLHLFAMEGTSFRFPAILLSGLVIALVYLWGTQARGRVCGVASAVLLAAMPRFFYQSHLACFDVPIVAIWTLTAYCYWRSLRDPGLVFPILTGLAFGLALDTKHNSWFLPILVIGHAIAREALHALTRGPGEGARAPLSQAFVASRRRGLAALAAMAILGPLVFYALWPWIWHDTLPRLRAYAAFHLNHDYYNIEFLGRNYWKPPMPLGYAWVMTVATVPTVTLALFAVGLWARARAWLAARSLGLRPDIAATSLLWLFCLLINYAAWLSPSTPIFGGTKHWMTAYPFLALFAGAGFDAVVRAARRELYRRRAQAAWMRRAAGTALPAAAVLGALSLLAPISETAHAHPFGLSSYTPLVGGAPGGASLGLNRTFWGYTTGSVVGYLNRDAPGKASVYFHDTAGPSWDMLLTDGRLRRDLRGAFSIAEADYGLYHHEKHMLGQEYQNWVAFGTVRPDHIGGLDGVPVILVYKRPDAEKARAP